MMLTGIIGIPSRAATTCAKGVLVGRSQLPQREIALGRSDVHAVLQNVGRPAGAWRWCQQVPCRGPVE
jgi:hypothetical protein